MCLSDIKHPATVSYDTDAVGVGLAAVTRTTTHYLINTSHTSSRSPRYPVRLTLTPLPRGLLRSLSIQLKSMCFNYTMLYFPTCVSFPSPLHQFSLVYWCISLLMYYLKLTVHSKLKINSSFSQHHELLFYSK